MTNTVHLRFLVVLLATAAAGCGVPRGTAGAIEVNNAPTPQPATPIVVSQAVTPGVPVGGTVDVNMPRVPAQGPGAVSTVGAGSRGGADGPPGAAGGPPPSAPAAATDTASWQTWQSDQWGFAVRYPPSFREAPASGPQQPTSLFRVAFVDGAAGPARFQASVYQLADGQTLEQWLVSSGLAGDPPRFSRVPVTIGGSTGVCIVDGAALAPNRTCYVARDRLVYAFTPLGPQAEQMLGSVTFLR
jgi:hypothetical protein